jgi:hypothetical protein
MNPEESKNTIDTSVPKAPVEHLSEEQKKALELSGQIEHAHGKEREDMEKAAQKLGETPKP